MLRMTVSTEEYLMIGEDVRLVFLGGTGKHLRIMIDAPRDKNIVRSTVLEKNITDPQERAKLPRYYAQQEHPEKYVKKRKGKENSAPGDGMGGRPKKSGIVITRGNAQVQGKADFKG